MKKKGLFKCTRCLRIGAGGHPDPCLGELPGVRNACCGHGTAEGYIEFDNGVVIRSAVGLRVDGVTRQFCTCGAVSVPHWHESEPMRDALLTLDACLYALETQEVSS